MTTVAPAWLRCSRAVCWRALASAGLPPGGEAVSSLGEVGGPCRFALRGARLLLPIAHLPASQLKPFIKVVNYTHLMPTRYALEVELKSVVTTDVVAGGQTNPTARQTARKEVKKLLEEKYNSSLKTGKNSAWSRRAYPAV